MPKYIRLTEAELKSTLSTLPEWSMAEGKLHREYKFRDFTQAFGFMATCATAIEKRDHHPEWFNVYGTVRVDLTTHDADGITQADVDLALLMEKFAKMFLAA